MPATRIWDAGGINNNWSNAKNWGNDIAPVAGDDLVFPANATAKTADNDFPAGTLFNSISLFGGYTLKGNRIRVGAGGLIDNSGSSDIIRLDLTVGIIGETLNRTFNAGTGSTLFIDGKIDGTVGLIKTGTGNLSLRANNSYLGQTQINTGILFVEKDESLGDLSGGVLVRTGATLLTNDQAVGVLHINEAITLEAGATLRALNDLELGGSVTLLGNAIFKHEPSFFNDKLSIVAPISGVGGVTIAAGSHVWYSGTTSNSYQGLTTVLGELHLDHGNIAIPGSMTINNGGVVQYEDNTEQISNAAVVTIIGTGQLLTNGLEETISRLLMIGGSVDGVDNHLHLVSDIWGNINVLEELRVTSFSSTISAVLEHVDITAPTTSHTLQVNDGPAFHDFLFTGVFTGGMTKEGPGAVLENSGAVEDRTYVINNGLYRYRNEDRTLSFIVNAGGEFISDGEIGSLTVNAGGRVRPGPLSSTGILTVKDNLTLNPGAILEVTLNGPIAGSGHDQIKVDGNVTIAGAILEPTLGTGVNIGNQFRIIDNGLSDAVIGSFTVPPASAPFFLATPTGQKLSISNTAGTFNNDVVLTLVNTSPMAPGLALNHTTINEGGSVTATGHLVDPDAGDRLKLIVNWGDGTREQVSRPGRDPFTLTHRYRDNGNYVAHFEWLDQHGTGNSKSFNVTVNNTAPQLQLDAFRVLKHHTILAGALVKDAGGDPFSVSIDYGDGSPVKSCSLHHITRLPFVHHYRQAGTFTVTVTARDSDGGETTIQRSVTV